MSEESIFLEAITIENLELREAFVRSACADDLNLLQQVRLLLKSHEEAGAFMSDNAFVLSSKEDHNVTCKLEEVGASHGSASMRIGRYRLERVIGEGGMGVVWEAEQTDPVHRRVALKIVKAGIHSRNFVARLEAERQTLAMMEHNNIAAFFDAGTSEFGQPYFVMELLHGVSITDFCEQFHLGIEDRLRLILEICSAVQHAHQKGIIHRDIKPSNVIVSHRDAKPLLKIIDFGIAKALGGSLRELAVETEFGQIVGTLDYMSPEQARLDGDAIDTRADIYSLGALMYEVIAGSPPFCRQILKIQNYAEMLRVIREAEPTRPSIRASRTEVTSDGFQKRSMFKSASLAQVGQRAELDCIVMKCLEKDPVRRFETVSALADDIQRYLNGEPIQSHPPSSLYRLRKTLRKNAAAVGTVIAVFLTLVCGIVISTTLAFRAMRAEESLRTETSLVRQQRDRAVIAERKAEDEHGIAESARFRESNQRKLADELAVFAKRQSYASQVNLAFQAYSDGNSARAIILLEGLRPRFDEQDFRSFEWYYLWNACHQGELTQWKAEKGQITKLLFSEDGKSLFVSSWEGVHRWDRSNDGTSFALAQTYGGGDMWSFDVSPDGKTLATAGTIYDPEDLLYWDIESAKRWTERPERYVAMRDVAFSSNGKWIAAAGGSGAILWDVATGRRKTLLFDGSCHSIAFSPNSEHIAVGNLDGHIVLLHRDEEGFSDAFEVAAHNHVVHSLAFSRDSQLLVSASREIKTWNVKDGSLRSVQQNSDSIVSRIHISHDGELLVTASDDRYARVIDLTTEVEREKYPHYQPVSAVAISPDGAWLATATHDGTAHIWDRTKRRTIDHFDFDLNLQHAALLDDGRSLVIGGTDHCEIVDIEAPKSPKQVVSIGNAKLCDNERQVVGINDDYIEWYELGMPSPIEKLKVSPGINRFSLTQDGKSIAVWNSKLLSTKVYSWRRGGSAGLVAYPPFSSDVTRAISVSISPSGKELAIGYELWWTAIRNTIAAGNQRILTQDRESLAKISCVQYSVDGSLIATGNNTGTIRIWDSATGSLRKLLKGHTDAIQCIAFSNDGQTLASGSNDSTARLWDVETAVERAALVGHHGAVQSVEFNRDETVLITGSSAGEVKLWRAKRSEFAMARRSELDRDDSGSAAGMSATARQYELAERLDEALEFYRQADERWEQVLKSQPECKECWEELFRNRRLLCRLLFQTGRADESIAISRTTLKSEAKILGEDNLSVGIDLSFLGEMLTRMYEFAEGQELLEQGTAIRQRLEPGTWNSYQSDFWLGAAKVGNGFRQGGDAEMRSAFDGMLARRHLYSLSERVLSLAKSFAIELGDLHGNDEISQYWSTIEW